MCAFSFRVRSELTNHSLILGMGKWKKQIFSTVSFSKLIGISSLAKLPSLTPCLCTGTEGHSKSAPVRLILFSFSVTKLWIKVNGLKADARSPGLKKTDGGRNSDWQPRFGGAAMVSL